MAVSGDVTIAQDGGQGNVKLHPYLVALVRWCASCLWSTATVLLHRLITGPLPISVPAITPTKAAPKPRAASYDHLHPEPKVECVVLCTPAQPSLDVIFVHGLYGSLANTWRQGEWKSKYKMGPNKIPLRRPASIPTPCDCGRQTEQHNSKKHEDLLNEFYNNIEADFTNIEEKFYNNILPNDNTFITEKFYNNDMVENIEQYETQAKFVCDLFKNQNGACDYDVQVKVACNIDCKDKVDEICKCKGVKQCEVGCGCVCDDCYSACWPKDWIQEDFPGARVISINYTSDPHLWRPLWVKESKRLRLHERAEQMMDQLLELGVGERPVVWVGHSKGGLFIKQIYCEAYEAYIQTQKSNMSQKNDIINHFNLDNYINQDLEMSAKTSEGLRGNVCQRSDEDIDGTQIQSETVSCINSMNEHVNDERCTTDKTVGSLNINDEQLRRRSLLWSNTGGFMFYSVPHRGSPLADIKTPLTARSVELLEITKDCELVLSLHSRWLAAMSPSRAVVRSLVETCRTLMSVLWLRIVSQDSADADIGALCGVPVDHREICKPSSRHCLLYTELTNLIRAALNKCQCQ